MAFAEGGDGEEASEAVVPHGCDFRKGLETKKPGRISREESWGDSSIRPISRSNRNIHFPPGRKIKVEEAVIEEVVRVLVHLRPFQWRSWIVVPDLFRKKAAKENSMQIRVCCQVFFLEKSVFFPRVVRALSESGLPCAALGDILKPDAPLAATGTRLKSWTLALGKYYASVQGQGRSTIDELTRVLNDIYDKKEAKNMTLTLAEAWILEGEVKGRAEGVAEGEVKSMIAFLEARFGEIPASLKKKLRAMRESDRIEKAVKLAATCNSLKEFQKGL